MVEGVNEVLKVYKPFKAYESAPVRATSATTSSSAPLLGAHASRSSARGSPSTIYLSENVFVPEHEEGKSCVRFRFVP